MPVQKIVKSIRLYFHNNTRINIKGRHVKLMRLNHPNNCLTLDLLEIPYLNLKGIKQILFRFRRNAKYKLEVQMEDRHFSLSRPFKYNKFEIIGPKMELNNLSKDTYRYFSVQFGQKRFSEDDPGKICKEYINTTYNDCDEEFLKNLLQKNYPAEFMPVWATSNFSLVTTFIMGDQDYFYKNYTGMILGSMQSDCPIPCTSTQITSVFLNEKTGRLGSSRIDITFSEKVSTVITNFPKFNLALFLSSCGGSMGLWLGVGVVQIMEFVPTMIWKLKENRNNHFYIS